MCNCIWKNFPLKLCLNLDSRPDRWERVSKEFSRLDMNVERFSALPAIGPHQSFTLSQKAMLQKFYDSPYESCILFEDDVYFKDFSHLENVLLYELPADWDILYLGGNIQDEKPERYSKHLFRVRNVWTTHAVAYRKPIVKYILENFPDENEKMYDNWLGNEVLSLFNSFIISPFICGQTPDRSDIWLHEVDYDSVFQQSENKLAIS